MKFFYLMLFVLSANEAFAAPLVGYSTPQPENQYKIFNAQGKQIFNAITDTVKRVELRDGFAVVQTSFNNVSLIREDGVKVIDSVYGSELKVSKKLLAVYNKNGIGAVYTIDGKKLYPTDAATANRPITEIQIANNRFALTDRFTDVFKVFNDAGIELAQFKSIKKALISDGFLSLTTVADTSMLFGESMDSLLSTQSNITGMQISDEFAGFFDYYGNLRLFTRNKGEAPIQNNVNHFSLTNYYAIVTGQIGTVLYGKNSEELELLTPSIQSMVTSHANFAYRGVTGAVWVKNEETGDSMVVNQADSFEMTDDLLLTRNGMGEFRVYSLKKGSFGRLVYSTLDQLISRFQLGNGIVSFQTGFFNAQTYETRVFVFNENAVRSSLVDETRINSVNLSVNREEWNWQ